MNNAFKRTLKAQAHHLKPVVLLGAKGLTESVAAEVNVALQTHELIKIKINGAEKEERLQMAKELCQQVAAEFIQMIGNTAIIYRQNPDK